MALKSFFEKWYKVIVSVLSFLINSVGLALTIIQMNTNQSAGSDTLESRIVFSTIIAAEVFLIIAVIYSVISILKNYSSQIKTEELRSEIKKGKNANRKIYENYKSIITTHKDHIDKMNRIIDSFSKEYRIIDDHFNSFFEIIDPNKSNDFIQDTIKSRKKEYEGLFHHLIDEYNIFMGNMTNILRSSIEEYLLTKGYHDGVSITIKQLKQPILYKELKNNNIELYTAFRDFRTYNSKKRTETWERVFHIHKNSDFISSIEKDYFIFNFMDKKYMEQGTYQNENTTYYEHYNSGVTCSIYSCINGERMLFGYLACDSLFNEKLKRKIGSDIYDWNIANIMMYSAQVIAMFLEKFLDIWSTYIVQFNSKESLDSNLSNQNNQSDEMKGFCNSMINHVKDRRYYE